MFAKTNLFIANISTPYWPSLVRTRFGWLKNTLPRWTLAGALPCGTSAYFEGRLLDGHPYLGLGNYATSLAGDRWSFNTYSVRDYVDRVKTGANPIDHYYELTRDESQAKYCLCSLNYGFIDEIRFEKRFGESFAETFAEELALALRAGWLKRQDRCWQVSDGQFGRMHSIRSLFYARRARRWLMEYLNPANAT